MQALLAFGQSLDNGTTANLLLVGGLVFLLVAVIGGVTVNVQADWVERVVAGALGLLLIGAGIVFHGPASAANPTAELPHGVASHLAPEASTVNTPYPAPLAVEPIATSTRPPAVASSPVPPGPSPAVATPAGPAGAARDATAAPSPVATSVAPSATAKLVPTCQVYPVRGFGLVYSTHSDVAFRLGCATEAEVGLNVGQQTFEHGVMISRTDTQQIVVIQADGSWKAYPDTYQAGETLAAVGSVPAGRLAPDRDFGKLWRQQTGVRQALGWATAAAQTVSGAAERFTGGEMLWTSNRTIYVLFADGTSRSLPDTFVDPTATPG